MAISVLCIEFTSGMLSGCTKISMEEQSRNGYQQDIQIKENEEIPLGAPRIASDSAVAVSLSLKEMNESLSATSAPSTPSGASAQVSAPLMTQAPNQTQKPAPIKTAAAAPASPKPNQTPAPQAKAPAPIVNPYVRYTHEQMMTEAKKLQERYPDLISLDSVGKSVEGRDLLLIKLGKGERKILFCGTHHAREYISSSYLMKMTQEYAKAYMGSGKYGNYNVKDLLNKATIYIVPMVNPDGVNLVNKGLKAVANQEAVEAMAMLKRTYREWKANINGVDLNRQYPAYWDVKYDNVGKPASENYKGKASATEPEVKAMIDFTRSQDFALAVSFHTKGNTIYWADKNTVKLIPGVEAMSKRLSKLTNYSRMPISEKPSVYGAGYENWFRLEFKRPAFCIELSPSNGTDVPHDDKKFDSLVWNKAKYIGLFFVDEALKRK